MPFWLIITGSVAAILLLLTSSESTAEAFEGYIWPLPMGSFHISSPFGVRINPLTGASGQNHPGLDLAAPRGTPIYAIAAGSVIDVSDNLDKSSGYGHRAVVLHNDGFISTYNHMDQRYVSLGDALAQGDQIGTVGTTGASTGNHLHFELKDQSNHFVDPIEYLPS